MGNSESATSDEEDMANDLALEESNEVIKVFQPRKLRDELENGKNECEILSWRSILIFMHLRFHERFMKNTV